MTRRADDFDAGDVDPWVAESTARRRSASNRGDAQRRPRRRRRSAPGAVGEAITADGGRSSGPLVGALDRSSPPWPETSPPSRRTCAARSPPRPLPCPPTETTTPTTTPTRSPPPRTLGERRRTTIDESPRRRRGERPPAADEPECAGTYTVVAGDYWLRFVESSGATSRSGWRQRRRRRRPRCTRATSCASRPVPQAPEPIAARPTTAAPDDRRAGATDRRPAAPTGAGDHDAGPARPAHPPAADAAAPAPPPGARPRRTVHRGVCGALPTRTGPTTAGPAEVEAMIREIWPDDIEERALVHRRQRGQPARRTSTTGAATACSPSTSTYVPNDLKPQFGIDEPSGPLRRPDEHRPRLPDVPAWRMGPLVADRPRLIAVRSTASVGLHCPTAPSRS